METVTLLRHTDSDRFLAAADLAVAVTVGRTDSSCFRLRLQVPVVVVVVVVACTGSWRFHLVALVLLGAVPALVVVLVDGLGGSTAWVGAGVSCCCCCCCGIINCCCCCCPLLIKAGFEKNAAFPPY